VPAAVPDLGSGPVPSEAVAALPKVELHVHLEGSMRPSTVLALAERNGVDLGVESEAELADRYRFRDFLHFIELFRAGLAVLRTLGGPEAEWPPELYADTFARARAAGVPAVVHAGEAAGPASVTGALDSLHALRIGHGVRSLEDRSVVRRLVDEQVPLEVSPTSNVLLGVTAPSIADHPIGEMIGLGMDVSVNTDDPGYFSTTLERELALVTKHHGVDARGLAALQRRAMSASFAPPELRAAFEDELNAWESTWGRA
jgi:adenosine deaminase